jgi:hypothetical protein
MGRFPLDASAFTWGQEILALREFEENRKQTLGLSLEDGPPEKGGLIHKRLNREGAKAPRKGSSRICGEDRTCLEGAV